MRIFVSIRIVCSWVSQLSHALLRCGSDKVGLHVIYFSFRIYQVLLTFTLNLNLSADHAIYHENRLFVSIFILVFLKNSFTTFYWVFFANLICLNLLDCHVPIQIEMILIIYICYCLTLLRVVRIVFVLLLKLSLRVNIRIWNGTWTSVLQRRKCLIDCSDWAWVVLICYDILHYWFLWWHWRSSVVNF